MSLKLDGASPLNRQVYRMVLAAIESGELQPGERLWSSRVIHARLGVSRNIVLMALAQLTAEGYLSVCEPPTGASSSRMRPACRLRCSLPPRCSPGCREVCRSCWRKELDPDGGLGSGSLSRALGCLWSLDLMRSFANSSHLHHSQIISVLSASKANQRLNTVRIACSTRKLRFTFLATYSRASGNTTRVRTGSLEEALFVLRRVPELDQFRVQDDYAARLRGKRHLILIAKNGDSLVGFKVGYELDTCTFYSWVGGVIPNHRRLHLARTLLAAQEKWASEVGYARIRVKTHERFGAMLKILQENNYVRVAEHNDRDGIVLERALPNNAPCVEQPSSS